MAPSRSFSFPSPNELSKTQREHIDRLWTSITKTEVYVPTHGGSSNRLERMDDHSLFFAVRLHHFFMAILKQALQFDNTARSSRHHIKGPHETCLLPLTRLVVISQKIQLPQKGSRVSIPHEDYLNELNSFELEGQAPTDDFIVQHSFGAFLHHRPKHALVTIRVAACLAIGTLWSKQNSRVYQPMQQQQQQQAPDEPTPLDIFLDTNPLTLLFVHVQPQVPMMNVKTNLAYKFVTVRGHVVKARPKRLLVVSADFTCTKCGASNLPHVFLEGRYSTPSKCVTPKCRSNAFSLMRHTAKYVNVQEVKLQEVQEETTAHAGRTPRQIEVQLSQGLVDSCRPGDIVSVAGIIQAVNSAIAAGKRAKESSTFSLYIQAHSITTMSETNNNNNNQEKTPSSSSNNMVYTQAQLESITKLSHADHRFFGLIERRAFPFDLLVRSLCPSIIGHDLVKAGILLSLLGGSGDASNNNNSNTNTATTTRSNSHMLIVGDPSVGKSQMLLAASQLAARSVYVGGNTTSTTGLTVSLTKEAGGEVGIEAGALVLADQGICCIDEFDKMQKVHQDGLLEAMEQQQISIAKAGIVAALPARCSVIAAANPKQGSYNMEHTVQENINMSAPILSRFDLIFILRDRADEAQDRLVSSNIMNLYLDQNSSGNRSGGFHGRVKQTSLLKGCSVDSENRMPLKDRLGWVAGFQQEPLPADLVRDYISYAREYCKPKLTQGAAAVLKDYFMKLRYPDEDSSGKNNTVPITTRQLEALIRLSQARAKACLRAHVVEEDALDVVELMMESMKQVHADGSGGGGSNIRVTGSKQKRKMKKAFVEALKQMGRKECHLDDLRRIANQVNCGLSDFPGLVEDLRNDGLVIKKANGSFQVTL